MMELKTNSAVNLKMSYLAFAGPSTCKDLRRETIPRYFSCSVVYCIRIKFTSNVVRTTETKPTFKIVRDCKICISSKLNFQK